jgi:uncharacterized delta-60 repeat protein
MLALALTATLALSGPGTLDRSFGHDGRVVTATSGAAAVAGVESVPRGKVLLAGTIGKRSIVLIRYRRDGSLDRSFGRKGVSAFRFDRDVTATDTLLQANGRLLVAGSLGDDALVLRFDRAGHLDPSLDHDGIAVVDFGASTTSGAQGIALQPDGSVVVLAHVSHEIWNGLDIAEGLGVARLDSSGNLDRTFGEQGFVREDPENSYDALVPSAIGVLPDGRLVVGFNYSGPKGSSAALFRLLHDGSTDPAVDEYGQFVGGSWLDDVIVQPSIGRLFLAGAGQADQPGGQEYLPAVAAFDAGAEKPAWRTALVDSTVAEHQVWASRLALDAKGRALVAGSEAWWQDSRKGGLYPQVHRADMIVARIRAGGRLDRCFGKRAVARIRFPSKLSQPAAITLGDNGKIVLAGPPQHIDEHPPHSFELARLHGGNCRR